MPTKVLMAIVSDEDFFAVYRSEDISFHPTTIHVMFPNEPLSVLSFKIYFCYTCTYFLRKTKQRFYNKAFPKSKRKHQH